MKISIHEDAATVAITLEGRIAGPWVSELSRVWVETAPRLASRKLSIDLRNVTYADVRGEQVLRDMCSLARTELVTSTPWTQYLANAVNGSNEEKIEVEAGNGYES
ncbi:MAG TPA: hypothetical protein VKR52_19685 [Terracidiphilus sp.]|nr:hypothetical protein [Terracidiphilus sp.]